MLKFSFSNGNTTHTEFLYKLLVKMKRHGEAMHLMLCLSFLLSDGCHIKSLYNLTLLFANIHMCERVLTRQSNRERFDSSNMGFSKRH